MRKRAMVIGLLLVPLATGGAVLLAKSSQQSAPKTKATITLPNSDPVSSESSMGEGPPGFVLAPSEADAEQHDLKQQHSEEQQNLETPKQPNSEDVDSDHAAAEVLFASEHESAEPVDAPAPAVSSPRDFFNSYAFANSRRSSGAADSGSTSQSGSAPSAGSKSPQSASPAVDQAAQLGGEPQDTSSQDSGSVQDSAPEQSTDEPGESNASHDRSGSTDTEGDSKDHGTAGGDTEPGDDQAAEETPKQPIPVPYFPPEDERPHVTVPEPSTLMLLGLGLIACAAASRRRRSRVLQA